MAPATPDGRTIGHCMADPFTPGQALVEYEQDSQAHSDVDTVVVAESESSRP